MNQEININSMKRACSENCAGTANCHKPHFLFALLMWFIILAVSMSGQIPFANADPYPPNLSNNAQHFPPANWPGTGPYDLSAWNATYHNGQSDNDPRTSDPSNGGTRPQNYVNVASSYNVDNGTCDGDTTQPSVYWAFDSATDTIFFRWRVEQIANTYATGPSPGAFSSGDPWGAALWTVFFDIDGDGFREFAVHLDGSSGSPSTQIDIVAGIYSDTPSQSIDYIGDSTNIKQIAHNPTAFIASDGSTILNYHSTNSPDTSWPNGSAEKVWDYGTTRSVLVSEENGCIEYFVDYQIPLGLLDASAVGGPTITENTPLSMFFVTANSLNNALQKDAVYDGAFIPDMSRPLPYGDFITLAGGTLKQPVVDVNIDAGCGPVEIISQIVKDALIATSETSVHTTVDSVEYRFYFDANGNGKADDGSNWDKAVPATHDSDAGPGVWTASWDSSGFEQGQYLIGVKAADNEYSNNNDGQTHVTYSFLTEEASEPLFHDPAYHAYPEHRLSQFITDTGPVPAGETWYVNPYDEPGVQIGTFINSCGSTAIAKTADKTDVTANEVITFTITITNTLSSALILDDVTDNLPTGFTYVAGSTSGTLGAVDADISSTSPLTWTGPFTIPVGAGDPPAAVARTIIFQAEASSVAGTYSNVAEASAKRGTSTNSYTMTADPVQINVGNPRLTISKAADLTSVNPGGTITYIITYSNDSTVDVTDIEIKDTLPAELTYVGGSASNGGANSGQDITWIIGDIASGAGGSVTYQATVKDPYLTTDPATIDNTVTIYDTLTPDKVADSTANASVYVNSPRPNLVIEKDVSSLMVSAGGTVDFTIKYANTGELAADNVIIKDTLPTGTTIVNDGTYPSLNTTYKAPTGSTPPEYTFNIGTVAAGVSGELVIRVTENTLNPNPGINKATINSDQTSESSEVTATISLVKAGGSNCLTPSAGSDTSDNTFDYSLLSANDDLRDEYTAPKPADTSKYQEYTFSFAISNVPTSVTAEYFFLARNLNSATMQIFADGSWQNHNLTPLPPNNKENITALSIDLMSYGVDTAAEVNNLKLRFTADASNPSSKQEAEYLNVCVTTPATPAELVMDKQVDMQSAQPGDTIEYTINFANIGGADATGATIVDTLPTGLTIVDDATSPLLNIAGTDTDITFTGTNPYTFAVRSSEISDPGTGVISAGESGTLKIKALVGSTASTPLTNNAVLDDDDAGVASVSDSATTVLKTPNVTVSKSADKTLLSANETVTYTLTVVNTGDGTANNVVVNDDIPEQIYFEYVAASMTGGDTRTPSGTPVNALQWDITSLAPGASATLTFQMKTTATDLPAGETLLNNSATVDWTGGTTGNSNTVTVSVNGNPNLTITKTCLATATPGGTLEYTVTVTNTGSAAAEDVKVDDPMPSYGTGITQDYVANSLKYDSAPLTDAKDADKGYFNFAGKSAVFEIGTLNAGASVTLNFSVLVNSSMPNGTTTVNNTATVSASNAASKQDTASFDVTAAPVLTISKTGPASIAFPTATVITGGTDSFVADDVSQFAVGQYVVIEGDTTKALITGISGNTVILDTAINPANGDNIIASITYGINYSNTGNAPATSVVITDTLPVGSVYGSGGTYNVGPPQTVTWNIAELKPGKSGNVNLSVILGSSGTHDNKAEIDSAETTPVSDTITTTAGGLRVSKRTEPVGPQTVTQNANGAQATYVIEVKNTSPSSADGVVVTDALPPGFTYASTTTDLSSTGGAYTGGTDTPSWGTFSIPSNGTLTIEFLVDIASSVGPGTYQNYIDVESSNTKVVDFDPLITTDEDVIVEISYDWGDAPDSYGTNLAIAGAEQTGARHALSSTNLYLGAAIDDETDGVPATSLDPADGDDSAGTTPDDEDGIASFSKLMTSNAGSAYTVTVTTVNTTGTDAYLAGWIDFDGNGTFDSDEASVIATVANDETSKILTFTVPADITAQTVTYARFRIADIAITNIDAAASKGYGEVEDYELSIVNVYDYGDAPDSGSDPLASQNYNTVSAHSGPSHVLNKNLYLGDCVDDDAGTLQNLTADADDTGVQTSLTFGTCATANDDEDGITTLPTLTDGQTAPTISVNVFNNTGGNATLSCWIDYNDNGEFEASEKVTPQTVTTNASNQPINVTLPDVPATAYADTGGGTYIRCRLATGTGADNPTGAADDGEVEDYPITINAGVVYDYGDAPDTTAAQASGDYDTILANGGPRHGLDSELYIGSCVDDDGGTFQNALADADDAGASTTQTLGTCATANDDEDGITVLPTLRDGQATPIVSVLVFNNKGVDAKLSCWVDYNNNGTFDNATERGQVTVPTNAIAQTMTVTLPAVPATASTDTGGTTFIRCRLATGADADNPTGDAVAGEVEDYSISIVADPPPVATDDISAFTPGTAKTVDVPANDTTGDTVVKTTVSITTTGATDTNSDGYNDNLAVAGEGTWTVDPTNGQITFAPEAGFTGTPTPIKYTIKDSQDNVSNEANVILTTDPPPVATDDTSAFTPGTAKTVDVPANDTTGDTVVKTTVSITTTGATDTNSDGYNDNLVVVGEGTWTVDPANGQITFTPEAGFTGTPTPIKYTIKDAQDNVSNEANVILTTDPPPVATDDTSAYTPGTAKTVDVPANDTTGDTVVKTTVSITTTGATDTNSDGYNDNLAVAGEGTWTVDPTNGQITFTPEAGFAGTPTPIKYTIKDAQDNVSNEANVILTTDPPPVATDDTSAFTPGTAKTVDVPANDTTGDTVVKNTVSITTTGATDTNSDGYNDNLVVAGEGTWTVDPANGQITFTPEAGFTGTPTPIKYTIKDAQDNVSNEANVILTTDPPPVATDDTSAFTPGTAKTVDVPANDTTGDTVVKTTVSITTTGATDTNSDGYNDNLAVAGEGTWTVDPTNGQITFTPEAGFAGTPTPIKYTIKDAQDNVSNEANVILTTDSPSTGTVSGKVFNDLNGDGIQNPGESGLPNVEVKLFDSTGKEAATATTQPDGNYVFNNIDIGSYTVQETDPDGFVSTTNNTLPVSVSPGSTETANFGDQELGTVSGVVFNDLNGNGIQEPGENGIAGVTIDLVDTIGTVVKTATSVAGGTYIFSNVDPGTYNVKETDLNDYVSTTNNTMPISVANGGSETANFGDQKIGTISGVVFNDLNGNGIQEAGEDGIGGVSVDLFNSSGISVQAVPTSVDGSYLFENVAPGSYTLEETDLADFVSTTRNIVSVSIASGGSETANFGDQKKGTVSGTVFNDLNGNGVQDTGETGISSVKVELLDSTGKLVKNGTTNPDGSYVFTDVIPGAYNVAETDPDGYVSTSLNTVSLSVSAGGAETANFGDQQIGTVSGVVFNDVNGNGTQDAGEDGIGGVEVTLVNSADNSTQAASTAGDGSYIFTGVTAGTYLVKENDPAGFVSTTNNTIPISLAPGLGGTANFGDQQTSTVSGTVFDDLNGNGVQEANENGIGGVEVTLVNTDGTPGPTVTTAGDGSYLFTGITPGAYTVEESDPDGFTSTSSNTLPISVAPGSAASANFGDHQIGLISGIVYNDFNGDGNQDANESGIGGVNIELLDADGSVIDTAVTSGDGSYVFTGVKAGTYTIQEADPPGFISTTNNDIPVSVAPNGSANANFGDHEIGSVSGTVFDDINANGVHDPGEPGLGGVTVTLTDSSGGEKTATTSGDGSYIFTSIAPGSYTVQETDPSGYVSVSTNTVPISIAPGGAATVNFIDQQIGTVSGTVFNDLNGDGNQDSNESGIGGISVELIDNNGISQGIITTSGDGSYIFTGVIPGTYFVHETDPSGFTSTTDNEVSVSVASGGAAKAVFGDQEVGTVSGTVFDDANGNHIHDPDDPGLGGVIIELLDTNGNPVAQTITSDDGSYIFTGIDQGTYTVQETDPSGYVSVTDNLVPVTLGPGGAATANFVDQQKGTIAGTVFNDLNGDGIQETSDPGIGGVKIELLDESGAVIKTGTTSGDGSYSFSGIAAGNYTVQETDPDGFESTTSNTKSVVVLAGGAGTASFGDHAKGTISGTVFNDTNGNGIQDNDEAGIGGVKIDLLDNSGAVLETVNSSGDGSYIFTGIVPGDYKVNETDPDGFTSTTSNPVPVTVTSGGAGNANFGDVTGRPEGIAIKSVIDENGGNTEPGDILLYTVTMKNLSNFDSDGMELTDRIDVNSTYVAGSVTAPGESTIVSETPVLNIQNINVPANGQETITFRVQIIDPLPAGVMQIVNQGTISYDSDGDGINDSTQQTDGDSDTPGEQPTIIPITSGPALDAVKIVALQTDADENEFAGPGDTLRYTVVITNNGNQDTAGAEFIDDIPLNTTYTDSVFASSGTAVYNNAANRIKWSGDITAGSSVTITFDVKINTGIAVGTIISNQGTLSYDKDGDGTNDTSNPSDGDTTTPGQQPTDIPVDTPEGIAVKTVVDENGGSAVSNDILLYTIVLDNHSGFNVTGLEFVDSIPANTSYVADSVTAPEGSNVISETPALRIQNITIPAHGEVNITFRVQIVSPLPEGVSQIANQGIVNYDTDGDGTNESSQQTDGDTNEPGEQPTITPLTLSSVTGHVFNDLNGNGIQDTGETGLENVVVKLTDANGKELETLTNADGSYEFADVSPGAYTVEETDPDGFFSTTSNVVPVSISADGSATANFGDQQKGTVSGSVFNDTNGNGIQDPGEQGLANVTIELVDKNGEVVTSVVTGENGSYMFANVAPGAYTVQETDPEEFFSTTNNVVPINIVENGSATAGFGDKQVGGITGSVFNDVNGNGIQDPGENGIANVEIELKDENGNPVTKVVSDENGLYVFEDIDPGNYTVYETDPDDFTSTTTNTVPVNVFTDGSATANFGDHRTGTISGSVFNDANGNGIQDQGETGIGGVELVIVDENGNVVDKVFTDEKGSYIFVNVSPGAYTIRETDPDGFFSTTNNIVPVNISENGAATANFGDQQSGTVSGSVFNDTNGNGIQDPGETGIGGVEVVIVDENGNVVGTTTTTDNGSYVFTDVPPGNYTIHETDPDGFTSATDNTIPVSVPKDGAATANFGEQQSGTISGTVFNDINGDSIQNPGEKGIGGVVLTLTDSSGNTRQVLTAGDGSYIFTSVPAGTYTVRETDAPGFASTTNNTLPVTIVDNGAATAIFGDQEAGSISGVTFNDIDGDGVQEPGEDGIGGVLVELKDENGNVVATTTTADDGSYIFTDIPPGNYVIEKTDPSGFDNTTGTSIPVTITPETAATGNFGHQQSGTISGVVFNDMNGDGVQNIGESGIGGVIVTLTDKENNIVTMTTAGDGSYIFTEVLPGTYSVRETDPAGFVSTTANSVPVIIESDSDAGSANFGDQLSGTAKPDLCNTTKAVADINNDDVHGYMLEPGENIWYGVAIHNTGNATAKDVVYSDTPDSHTALVNKTVVTSDGIVISGNNDGDTDIVVNVGDIAPGASVEITYYVKLSFDAPDGLVVKNQGMVTASNHPDEPTDFPGTSAINDPTIIGPVNGVTIDADLSALKTASDVNGDILEPGDIIEYSIEVKNNGPDAAVNLDFTDNIPIYTTFVPGTLSADYGTVSEENPLRVFMDRFEPGNTVNISFRVRINDDAPDNITILNQGVINGDGGISVVTDDPGTSVIDDPTALTISGEPPYIEAYKAVMDMNGGSVNPGDPLKYTITVINNGNVNATGVIFNDNIDGYISLRTGTVVTDKGTINTGNGENDTSIQVDIGELDAGEAATITFEADVSQNTPNGAAIHNQGEVTSGNYGTEVTDDPSTEFIDDPTDVVVIFQPGVLDPPSATKDVSGGRPVVRWEMLWINDKVVDTLVVHVEDTMPDNTTYVPGTLNASSGTEWDGVSDINGDVYWYDESTNTVIWEGSIPSGESVRIWYETTVPPDVNTIENQACAIWDINGNQDWRDEQAGGVKPVCTDDPDTGPDIINATVWTDVPVIAPEPIIPEPIVPEPEPVEPEPEPVEPEPEPVEPTEPVEPEPLEPEPEPEPIILEAPTGIKTVSGSGPVVHWEMVWTNDNTDAVLVYIEDMIPENTAYVPESLGADFGAYQYNETGNMVSWEDMIPGNGGQVTIWFDTLVNEDISQVNNQAHAVWDKNGNGDLEDEIAAGESKASDNPATQAQDDPTQWIGPEYNLTFSGFIWKDICSECDIPEAIAKPGTPNAGLRDIADRLTGINGVSLTLYKDNNEDGVYTPETDQPVKSVTTITSPGIEPPEGCSDKNGYYVFDNLRAGDYIVRIDSGEFNSGGTIFGYSGKTQGAFTLEQESQSPVQINFMLKQDDKVQPEDVLGSGSDSGGGGCFIKTVMSDTLGFLFGKQDCQK